MAGLARHVDPDELLASIRQETHRRGRHATSALQHTTPYSTRYNSQQEIPKFEISMDGAPADAVHEMLVAVLHTTFCSTDKALRHVAGVCTDICASRLRNELDLDGRPNLNLASFVGTYMEDHANQLIMENISKNLSDADEYPAMMNMHARCVNILANLWNAQKGEKPIGTATTGSSEAIQLGGLAMKRRWQEMRQAQGKDILNPNIIMGTNAQVALEKFARYFDVEGRILPVSEKSRYRLDPELVKQNLDENTIGVFVILGSTYTGHYEPVQEISDILDEFEAKTGIDIPIHVDAASGGFIAPFTYTKAGGQKWDFELPRVKSINTSGHKFGLVYAGVGWIIFRDESYLPKYLIFELHYLGGTEETYTLNFSRPGAQVIGQYFNLIHLGFNGYREIMENALENARILSKSLERTGWYRCVSDIHRKKGQFNYIKGEVFGDSDKSSDYNEGLPVVSFTLTDEFKKEYPHIKQVSVSNLLRARQYIIPNYPLPPNEEETEILRVVVRESMSLDLLDRLISDIVDVTEHLMSTSDQIDLAPWQPVSASVEKKHANAGRSHESQQTHRDPMSNGVHRTVC